MHQSFRPKAVNDKPKTLKYVAHEALLRGLVSLDFPNSETMKENRVQSADVHSESSKECKANSEFKSTAFLSK